MKIKGSLFVVVLFLIDIISKYYIESILEVSESIVIIKNFFSITYALNTGAAFSILEGNMIFFYTVSVIGLVFMAFLYKSSKKNIEKYFVLMMVAGTLGNLYDRILFQYVRDFLDFIIFGYDYAIFNFADTFLVTGVVLYIGSSIYDEMLKGRING